MISVVALPACLVSRSKNFDEYRRSWLMIGRWRTRGCRTQGSLGKTPRLGENKHRSDSKHRKENHVFIRRSKCTSPSFTF
jgi:hypothetical protein